MTPKTENMLSDLIRVLHGGGHSLVVAADRVRTFDGRGISDLYALLTEHPDRLRGASVADKVVGKGAAALMVLGGVREVYADVVSTPALDLLRANGLPVRFAQEVPHIVNRAGTGLCPIETRCMPCRTPEECLERIRSFIVDLKTGK